MAQIRKSSKLSGLEHHLNDLWKRSTLVAAFAYVLARNCSKVNPDEAMLTGMMHGIGKLYVLTRVIDHPELFASNTMLNQIIGEWHCLHRQGHSGKLEFLRGHGAGGRRPERLFPNGGGSAGFDRCRSRCDSDGLAHR